MPLATETNTPEMHRRVLRAFVHGPNHIRGRRGAQADFEHGQWWITCRSGAQYAVVDAVGNGTIDGFAFEQVSEGEEE